MDKSKYKRMVECRVGSHLARVYLLERTEEEQRRCQKNLEEALQRFGKEMVKAGLL